MKYLSSTRLALVAIFILSGLKIFAAEPDFQVNGIYYKVVSFEERECSVCGPVNSIEYVDKLIIPSEVKFNGASFTVVSVWGEQSFRTKASKYARVKELILPNTVTRIEECAFVNSHHGNHTLERVQMDGVEYIADNAFESCENLKTISTALNRLRYIGFAAFSDCRSLEKVIIPPSCKKIEKSAFLGCVNPRLSVVIEDSDEPLLCNSTFGSGKKIYLGRNILGWYGFEDTKRHIYQGDIYYFKEIEFGDKVTIMLAINPTRRYYGDLDNLAFKVTIGASIKEVPDFANDDMTIQSLYLISAVPPRVKGAFSNRTYLHGTLYVPKGSLAAYKDAPVWKNFLNIQEYETSRTIAANKEYFAQLEEENARKEEMEQKARLEAKRKAEEEANRRAAKEEAERYAREVEARMKALEHPVVPDGTTKISAYAYKGRSIKSITIPNTVTRIEDRAFEGCTNLTSVTIPNSVTSIGKSAFSGCIRLTSVIIPNSVITIGREAFKDCSGLTSVTISNSVTNIGEGAFSGCKRLTSPVYNAHVFAYMPTNYSGAYTIPDGIEKIVGEAFAGCEKITSIAIPNSVTSIGYRAFDGCRRVSSLAIPKGVTRIGHSTFQDCTGLIAIEIPNTIGSIGDFAFSGCTGLTTLTIPRSVSYIGIFVFDRCKNLKISLPKKWKDKVNLQDCKKVKYYK